MAQTASTYFSPLYILGGSLSLTAGLAWNDAFKGLIDHYYPLETAGTLRLQFTYAIILTIFVILMGYILLNLSNTASDVLIATKSDVSTIYDNRIKPSL